MKKFANFDFQDCNKLSDNKKYKATGRKQMKKRKKPDSVNSLRGEAGICESFS